MQGWVGEHLEWIGYGALTASWGLLLYVLGIYEDVAAFLKRRLG